MKLIENNELEQVIGGTNTFTGPIINACTNVIKTLMDVGRNLGSSIRRIAQGSVCPLP